MESIRAAIRMCARLGVGLCAPYGLRRSEVSIPQANDAYCIFPFIPQKIYTFPPISEKYTFFLNLRFLFPPILTMMHHALHVMDVPVGDKALVRQLRASPSEGDETIAL